MSENTVTLAADDATATALVAHIRSAVNSAAKYTAYADAHNVVREMIADHARALASLAYPNEKPVQKVDGVRTRYGNAVQAAAKGLRDALGKADPATTDWIKLVRQAASNASEKGGFDAATILAAVSEALGSTEIAAA